MRHSNAGVAVLPAQLPKPMVAEPPGCHLYGNAFLGSIGRCFKALYVAGDAVSGSPGAYKGFVAVGIGPSQAEVAVRNGKRFAAAANLFCKAH